MRKDTRLSPRMHVCIPECGGPRNKTRVSNESHSFGVNTTYYEVNSPSSEAPDLERCIILWY